MGKCTKSGSPKGTSLLKRMFGLNRKRRDHQKNRIIEILISNAPMNYIHVMKQVLSALMLNMRTLSTGARHQSPRYAAHRPWHWGAFCTPRPTNDRTVSNRELILTSTCQIKHRLRRIDQLAVMHEKHTRIIVSACHLFTRCLYSKMSSLAQTYNVVLEYSKTGEVPNL